MSLTQRLGVGLTLLILLGVALLGFGGHDLNPFGDPKVTITLSPLSAKAGELTTFNIKTTGEDGTVSLPEEIIPVIKGRLYDTGTISFGGSHLSFQALLPHSLSELEMAVRSEGRKVMFKVDIEPGNSPLLSGQDYYDTEVHLVDTYPGRVTGSNNFQSAMNHFQGLFEGWGLETEMQQFQRQENLRNYDVWNLLGYHRGQRVPDEWIVVGAHLDIVDQTYQGAYDNGAGASAIAEIAQAVARLSTDRTIVMALWGGEEQGLWGSEHFLENLPEEVTVKTYLNFDMPGINWPGRDPFHGYVGPDNNDQVEEHPALLELMDRAVFDILQYPDIAFIGREQEVGSGDHDTFMAAGIPSVFFFGMTFESWTTNYHTPTDTVEGMELHAGGHDALVGGFNTVAWVGYYTIILLDNDELIHPA